MTTEEGGENKEEGGGKREERGGVGRESYIQYLKEKLGVFV